VLGGGQHVKHQGDVAGEFLAVEGHGDLAHHDDTP
jgi:hypothetical protein